MNKISEMLPCSQRPQHQWRGEQQAAGRVGPSRPRSGPRSAGDQRAEQAADGRPCRSARPPGRAGCAVPAPRTAVQRGEHEVEEVIVATAISDARTSAEPPMNRAPASAESPEQSAGGSAGRIRPGRTPSPGTTARPRPPRTGRTAPAPAGRDARAADERQRAAAVDRECPSKYRSGATIETNSVASDTLKPMLSIPAPRNVTAKQLCQRQRVQVRR